jgi:predicted membrane channel-forming protein YqfA (hemolysin III family)
MSYISETKTYVCHYCGTQIPAPKQEKIESEKVKKMRPIAYGLIIFFGSGVLWFLFSVLAGLEAAFSGTRYWMILVYVFGAVFFLSLPVAAVAEIVRWWRRRQRRE